MSLSLWHSSKSLVRIFRASLLLFSFFLQMLYWKKDAEIQKTANRIACEGSLYFYMQLNAI